MIPEREPQPYQLAAADLTGDAPAPPPMVPSAEEEVLVDAWDVSSQDSDVSDDTMPDVGHMPPGACWDAETGYGRTEVTEERDADGERAAYREAAAAAGWPGSRKRDMPAGDSTAQEEAGDTSDSDAELVKFARLADDPAFQEAAAAAMAGGQLQHFTVTGIRMTGAEPPTAPGTRRGPG